MNEIEKILSVILTALIGLLGVARGIKKRNMIIAIIGIVFIIISINIYTIVVRQNKLSPSSTDPQVPQESHSPEPKNVFNFDFSKNYYIRVDKSAFDEDSNPDKNSITDKEPLPNKEPILSETSLIETSDTSLGWRWYPSYHGDQGIEQTQVYLDLVDEGCGENSIRLWAYGGSPDDDYDLVRQEATYSVVC